MNAIAIAPALEPKVIPGRYAEYIVGMRVDVETYATATRRIIAWAQRRQFYYVCIANVHMAMETRDSARFRAVVNGADMVTADGMPLVWTLRARGQEPAERVYGPNLMLETCQAAELAGISVALVGSTDRLLTKLTAALHLHFPKLQIVAAIAPPFGAFTDQLNDELGRQLASSGAGIVFVGLGCPKQELWMAGMRNRVAAVFLGVGAAFNFHAGEVKQAPAWLQRAGLEWAFRMAMEPRRLWRRYLWHNPRFMLALARESRRLRSA